MAVDVRCGRFERRLCRRNRILGGRLRQGGEAPLRRKDAVAFIVLIVVLLVQVAGWLPWRIAEEA